VVSALESIRAKEQGFCFAIDHDDQTNQITKIAFMSSKQRVIRLSLLNLLVPDQDAKARIAASGFLQHEDISSFNWFFRFVSNEVASWEPEIAFNVIEC